MTKLHKIIITIIAGLITSIAVLAFTGPGALTPGTGNPDFWIKSGLDVNYNVAGGNVGIGNTGPGYKLDVSGNGRFTTNLTVGGNFTVSGSTSNTCTKVAYTVGETVSCPQYYYTNTIGTPTQSGSIICCKVDNPT